MSPDGRYVAFASVASNLVPGDTNGGWNGSWYWGSDIFVRDRVAGTTTRVSVATGGAEIAAPLPGAGNPSISADGRFVAFASPSNALSPLDTDAGYSDVFVHDTLLVTTRLVSEPYGGPLDLPSFYTSMSADGRFVAFLNGNGSQGTPVAQVWVRDLQTGTAELVSQSSAGVPADDDCVLSTISADGSRVAFDSAAQNLAPNTSSTDLKAFVRTRAPTSDYASFCFGDGSGTACTCGNASVPEHREGCLHSQGIGGKMTALGASDATADTFQLVGTGVPDSIGMFIQGTMRINGGDGVVFGDGLRCVGGSVLRLRAKPIVGGTVRYPEAGETPISQLGGLVPGDVRSYQLWFRNAAAFCTVYTWNLTNGIETTW
jgi:hypothetical protein